MFFCSTFSFRGFCQTDTEMYAMGKYVGDSSNSKKKPAAPLKTSLTSPKLLAAAMCSDVDECCQCSESVSLNSSTKAMSELTLMDGRVCTECGDIYCVECTGLGSLSSASVSASSSSSSNSKGGTSALNDWYCAVCCERPIVGSCWIPLGWWNYALTILDSVKYFFTVIEFPFVCRRHQC